MFFTKWLHLKEKRGKKIVQILTFSWSQWPLRRREQTPSGAVELLSPFSCFYLELVRAYPLKVPDFVLLCLSGLRLNLDMLAAYVGQPKTLRQSDWLDIPVVEEWFEHLAERKGKKKGLLFSKKPIQAFSMRLMCVFRVNYIGRCIAAGELVMKDCW